MQGGGSPNKNGKGLEGILQFEQMKGVGMGDSGDHLGLSPLAPQGTQGPEWKSDRLGAEFQLDPRILTS